ncbi:hypothetical protein HD806DRAFT_476690 [Xylariaceae sp. AK1471]|nr:hypothetical protein HD806DRAFT_476690 [Xylariaceae sp. AK1471]
MFGIRQLLLRVCQFFFVTSLRTTYCSPRFYHFQIFNSNLLWRNKQMTNSELPRGHQQKPSRPSSRKHLANIASRKKNHEYRKYRLPDGVERLWLYETANGGGTASITHIAVIPDSVRHVPGQVPTEPPGIGNDDFNAGLKQSKYGYPILELYELVQPVTRAEMKSKWDMSAPMGWRYVWPKL